MTDPLPTLSRADFDQLLARAIRVDAEGAERLDLEKARSIAAELGVSTTAWETALCEQEADRASAELARVARKERTRLKLVALAGIAAGVLSGALANRLSDGVMLLGGFSIVVAAGLMIDGLRHRSVRQTQLELASWWGAVLSGIFLGLGQIHIDPIVFVGTAWTGSALLTWALDRFRNKAQATPPLVI